MNRAPLLALVAVAVAVAAYFLLARGEDHAAKTPAGEPEATARADQGGGGSSASTGPRLPADPSAGSGAAERPATQRGDFVEFRSDAGVRIRDHRNRDVAVDPDTPVRQPFKTTRIEPGVVATMGRELRGVARRCVRDHASEIGEGARVQPRVTFEIHQGRLSITDADIGLENIAEDSQFAACMSSGAIGLTVEAAGHREVEHHSMLVPIDLDKLR